MLGAVDVYESLGDKGSSNQLYELAPLDRHPPFARVLSLRALAPLNKCTGFGPFLRPSAVSPIIIGPTMFVSTMFGAFPGVKRPTLRRAELFRSTNFAHEPSFEPTVLPVVLRAAMNAITALAPLPVGVKVLALVLSNLYTVDAVCPHCKDTILPVGHLPAACPLVVELNKNADIFATKKLGSSPTVAHSMTHELAMQFTRPVVDAIVGLACAPVQGVQVDFTDAMYNQASAHLKPDGTCTFAHKCNQFVSDKGPGGYCMGPHARCNGCDYDATKKLRSPAA